MPGHFDVTVQCLDILMLLYNTWTFKCYCTIRGRVDETVHYLDVLMLQYNTWTF